MRTIMSHTLHNQKRRHDRFALGYSHPSSMILVDDHANFLKDMEMNVPKDVLSKSFEDPREALNWINDFGGVERNLVHRAISYHGPSGDGVLLNCDIGMLEDGIMDPQRFELPTVVITDFDMPGMDGLELCAGINDQQVKKILLTGAADENTGLDAFNSGLIDGFVMKGREGAADMVFELAMTLQSKYFTDQQNPFLGGSGAITGLFDDASAIGRIQEILDDAGYVEHYMASNPFGYVVVTVDGKIGRIGIFNDEDMNTQLRLAKNTNAPVDVIRKLEHRSHAAMFYQMEPTTYQTDEYPWPEVIMPCEKVIGINDWWFAVDDNGPAPADYDPKTESFQAKLYA